MRNKIILGLFVFLLFVSSANICLASNKDVIEISVQDVWSDSLMWGRVWLESIAKFEEQHPNIKINRIYVPLGENIEKILLQSKTKSLPEIITIDTQDIPYLAQSGALLDLTPYVEDWETWDEVMDGSKGAVSYNGKPYCMQFTQNTLALHYNKDLFEEAGLTRPPKDWEELELWAKKLTIPEKGQYGFAYSAYSSEEATWHFEPILWSNGGDLLALDEPEAIEALNFYTSFVKKGYTNIDVVNWNQGDVGVQFRLGKAAMIIQGCWDIPLSQEANMNFEVAVIPPPKEGMPTIVPIGGETFGMSPFSSPEKKEAAWTFLKWLMEEEMEAFNMKVNNIPTRASIAKKVIDEKPILEAFVKELQNGRSRSEYGGGVHYPNVSIAVREAIQKVITHDDVDAEEVFNEAAEKIRDIMK